MKNDDFKNAFMKALQPIPTKVASDFVNLQDDKSTVIFGPFVEDIDDSIPPFYLYLNIHDKILHNFLMESGALHNLMSKVFMDELGLEVTREYQDLYSFDSQKFQCLGVIKDLTVSLF